MAGGKIEVQYGAVQCGGPDREDTRLQFAQRVHASLCANCKHQGDCVFLAHASAPVFECELHECGVSRGPLLVVRTAAPTPGPEDAGETPLLGLCTTCENLRGCGLPRLAGGVWACEEYS
jgi:hypothetical protein